MYNQLYPLHILCFYAFTVIPNNQLSRGMTKNNIQVGIDNRIIIEGWNQPGVYTNATIINVETQGTQPLSILYYSNISLNI